MDVSVIRIRSFGRYIYRKYVHQFVNSEQYWIDRYNKGGNSGFGSYNKLAKFKADIINNFVMKNKIETIIEFGCGDGNQLMLANYPNYTGYDISQKAVDMCKHKFRADSSKKFKLLQDYNGEKTQLTLSLDVIYHLVEDEIFQEYMERLFKASTNYVIIYSSNYEQNDPDTPPHIKHRNFSKWIETEMPQWRLESHVKNKYPYTGKASEESVSDFYIYSK